MTCLAISSVNRMPTPPLVQFIFRFHLCLWHLFFVLLAVVSGIAPMWALITCIIISRLGDFLFISFIFHDVMIKSLFCCCFFFGFLIVPFPLFYANLMLFVFLFCCFSPFLISTSCLSRFVLGFLNGSLLIGISWEYCCTWVWKKVILFSFLIAYAVVMFFPYIMPFPKFVVSYSVKMITVLFSRRFDWLVDWLFDWLIDWLAGWLIDGWLIDWLIDWKCLIM